MYILTPEHRESHAQIHAIQIATVGVVAVFFCCDCQFMLIHDSERSCDTLLALKKYHGLGLLTLSFEVMWKLARRRDVYSAGRFLWDVEFSYGCCEVRSGTHSSTHRMTNCTADRNGNKNEHTCLCQELIPDSPNQTRGVIIPRFKYTLVFAKG